jgi:hypothetical protein
MILLGYDFLHCAIFYVDDVECWGAPKQLWGNIVSARALEMLLLSASSTG